MANRFAAGPRTAFIFKPALWAMSIGVGALIGTVAAAISPGGPTNTLNAPPRNVAAVTGDTGAARTDAAGIAAWAMPPRGQSGGSGAGQSAGAAAVDGANDPAGDANPADDSAAQAVYALLSTIGGGGIDATTAPPTWPAPAHLAANKAAGVDPAAPEGTATLASWNYAAGWHSGHLSVTGTDIASDDAASLGFDAGTTLQHGPFRFSGTLTGSDSGAWNGLASGQAAFGSVKLTASSSYGSTVGSAGDSGQMGYALSASTTVFNGVTLNGGFSWAHAEASASDTRSYHGAIQMSHQLAKDLNLTGEIGVSGSGAETWATPADAYGTTALQWTPGGGSVISTSFTDNADGQYHLATALNRQF